MAVDGTGRHWWHCNRWRDRRVVRFGQLMIMAVIGGQVTFGAGWLVAGGRSAQLQRSPTGADHLTLAGIRWRSTGHPSARRLEAGATFNEMLRVSDSLLRQQLHPFASHELSPADDSPVNLELLGRRRRLRPGA
jgi:hypothetical protein